MTKEELIEFITEYSESNIEYLQSDTSKDYGFLFSICGIVKDDFSICSDRLVIDLYISLSNVAKETSSIYTDYPLFANELLNRGHIKYFEFYFEGVYKSFDTLLSSARIELEKHKIIDVLEYLEKQTDKEKYEHMIERFNWLLNK